ncbi:MAG TPA: rhodanese-like domain-containing protein [Chitinophagales bacterium]|nr:rhodanese-like domain-containing protein [Chitinophagales bacterium]
MKTITAKELKQRLDTGEEIKLVNALEENKFRLKHIPGSLNIFRREDLERFLSKDEPVVVYCTDAACNKSIMLYQLLEALGYNNVVRFSGGMVEWENEGYKLEGDQVN